MVVGNINTFPTENGRANVIKQDKLKNLVANESTDIVLMSEHNKNMRVMKENNKPELTMKKWWEKTIVRTAYLRSSSNTQAEPGGTMIVTNTRSTAHTIKAGEDAFLLGRWNYITLRGRRNRITTIISIYRPQNGQSTSHRQLIASIPRREDCFTAGDPSKLWFRDLGDLVHEKLQEGHELIIAGDFNEDLNNEDGQVNKFMRSFGLREVMLEKYGKGPATYIRGTKTIDGIFATKNIEIKSGYYVPFHESPSDHRWVIVEFDEKCIIKGVREDKCSPTLRRATAKIPSVKKRFQELLERKICQKQLNQKMNILFDNVSTSKSMSRHMIQQYESIEEQMKRIVKYADRRCRKLRHGKVPYSPMLKILMGKITVLSQIKLRMELVGKPNRPHQQKIQRLAQKYKYDGRTKFSSIEQITRHIQQAQKVYKQFKPQAYRERGNYLARMAYEYSQQDHKSQKSHYKTLIHREKIREQFRLLRYKEGRGGRNRVECIAIKTEQGETVTYDKSKIEQGIMEANKKKLLQAEDTPLRSIYQELFGEQGQYKTWEDILEKKVSLPEDATDEMIVWYKYMTNYQRTDVELSWTTEEYLDSWAKMDENKVTTPGIQVAHIKCLESTSSAARIVSRLALIPIISGYSPESWKIGIDSMIPKKSADIRPEKLRLILLMDARFNHNNKLIGKKMMETGEKMGWLASEQFGSRKAKSAIEHALNKRLSFDLIRQQRLEAVYIANDAKSCYDRILLMVAYLTMRNYGIPACAAKSSIECIFKMKHYIRTKYGDSESYYGGEDWEVLPHGCGQGNGYGPALWACISSPLLQIMKQYNHGAKFKSCLTGSELHLAGIAFVDDTDLFETDSDAPNKDVVAAGQDAIHHWNTLLRITGGALEPTKTFWCKMGNEPNDTQQISIECGGSVDNVPRKSSEDSFFTLGVWQSPSGNERCQVEFLHKKIIDWTNTTGSNYISRYSARTAILSTIGRTMVYSLPATAFSPKESKEIQSTVNKAVLGRMGIVRTASTILANSPTCMGGYGIVDIEVEQMVQHVNTLALHMHQDTITGQLIRMSLDQYVLEVGKQGCPFDYPHCSYVTAKTWVSNTIASIQKYHIGIHGCTNQLDKWITTDSMIMDSVRFNSTGEARTFNNVRMYLQVVTVSDLFTVNGDYVDENLLAGDKVYYNPSPSRWRYSWPPFPEPTRHDKQVWTMLLRRTFGIGTDGRSAAYTSRRTWNRAAVSYSCWLYSNTTENIYEKQQRGLWLVWTSAAGRREGRARGVFSALDHHTDLIPEDAVPCSIMPNHNGYGIRVRTVGQVSHVAEFIHGAVAQLGSYQWILHNLHLPQESVTRFLYQLINGQGIVHTDGSYTAEGTVTYACIAGYSVHQQTFEPSMVDMYIHGFNAVPGSYTDCNSYRGELAGILSAICTVNVLCSKYDIQIGGCTIYCDNQGALSAAFGYKRPMPKWASYDLVTMIRYQLQQSPIQWRPKHIKSHQDDHVPFEDLAWDAQGNVLADYLTAKSHRVQAQWPDNLLPGEPWRIVRHGQPLGGNIIACTRNSVYKPRIQQQWTRIFGISPTVADRCLWTLFYKCWERQTRDSRIWWVKFASRTHPIGRNLVRRLHSSHGKCPCCGTDEDPNHLIQCTHPRLQERFTAFRGDFYQKHCGLASPDLLLGVVHLVEAYRRGLVVYTPSLPPLLYSTLVEQFRMGQGPFFTGLWLRPWLSLQQDFLGRNSSRRSPTTWLLSALSSVQQLLRDLWDIRNDILFKNQHPAFTAQEHEELNVKIRKALDERPPYAVMRKADRQFFRRYTRQHIEGMNFKRKQRWLEGAEAILRVYKASETPQAVRFRSYFQWDTG